MGFINKKNKVCSKNHKKIVNVLNILFVQVIYITCTLLGISYFWAITFLQLLCVAEIKWGQK